MCSRRRCCSSGPASWRWPSRATAVRRSSWSKSGRWRRSCASSTRSPACWATCRSTPLARTINSMSDPSTLLGQLVALRQEVNLQTRAARSQQEQSAQTLEQLGQALDLLRRRQESPALARAPDAEEAVRPLLKTLLDLHDALALAAREVQ